jgi:hypothetical protein
MRDPRLGTLPAPLTGLVQVRFFLFRALIYL